jgi:antitoxin-like ribbon-helix-helix protein
MVGGRRVTVYFEPEIHKGLRLKAAESGRSMSDLVNDAVRLTLAEDAADLRTFETRRREPDLDFKKFVRTLKRRSEL